MAQISTSESFVIPQLIKLKIYKMYVLVCRKGKLKKCLTKCLNCLMIYQTTQTKPAWYKVEKFK